MNEMDDDQYDLAIVDPPYGLGHRIQTTANGTTHELKNWNHNIPTKEYFSELHRVSKHQIIWGCNYFRELIPAVGRIIHDKQMDSQEGTNWRFSQADVASCSMQKRITMYRYRWNGNRQGETINWKNDGINKRIHPTQKPVQLYQWLLKNYAKDGFVILDTHLGSGSLAVACAMMGYDMVGYEIDKDYYTAAQSRVNDFLNQGELFHAK